MTYAATFNNAACAAIQYRLVGDGHAGLTKGSGHCRQSLAHKGAATGRLHGTFAWPDVVGFCSCPYLWA